MKLIDGHIWLTWKELQGYGISKNTIDRGTRSFKHLGRCTWQQRPCPDTGRKLIKLATVPPAIRCRLPAEEELIGQYMAAQNAVNMAKERLVQMATDQLKGRLQNMLELRSAEVLELQHSGYDAVLAGQVGRLAAWLRLAAIKNKQQWEPLGLSSRKAVLQAIIDAMSHEYESGLLCGRRISHTDVLVRKLRQLEQEGIACLVHKNTGNKNPQKLSDKHAHILLKAYRDQKKVSKWHAYEKYSHLVQKEGEKPVSYSCAKAFLHKNHNELAAALTRYNKRVVSAHFTPNIHRRRPDHSLDLVTGDGVPLSETVVFPKGHFLLDPKVQTDKLGTINVWCWYDTASEALLSWAVSRAPAEPFNMVRTSFRDIAKLYGRLPIEVALDQGKARNKAIKQMMSAAGVAMFEKEAYISKNLFAERLHEELLRLQGEYSPARLNITTSNYKNRREGIDVPADWKMRTADEMIQFIAELVAIYNHEPQAKYGGKSRMEVFMERINPAAVQINDLDRLFLFAQTRTVTVRTNYIKFEEGKNRYEYLVPAEAISTGKVDRQMLAKWDEDQPDTILLCDMSGAFVCECKSVSRHNMARMQMTAEDHVHYQQQQKEKSRYMAAMKAIGEDNDAYADEHHIVAGLEEFGQERRKQALANEQARQMINHYLNKYDLAGDNDVDEHECVPVERSERVKKKNLLDL